MLPLARAESLLDQGDSRQALMEVDAYLKAHPGNQRALSIKARVLVKRGQWSIAIRMFEKAGAATARDLHAWAEALLHRQQWSEARSVLRRVLELEPHNRDALHEMTACEAKLGRLDDALLTAERFAKEPDCGARGHLLIATLQKELGNPRSALKAYSQVLAIQPQVDMLQITPAEFFHEYGNALLADGRADEAVPLFLRGVKAEKSALGYVDLGEAYSQVGDSVRAVASWKNALELDSQSVAAREALANAALRSGDARAALEWLDPVRDSESPSTSLAYLFQRVYTLVGDEEQTRHWTALTRKVRKRKRIFAAIENVLSEAPRSFWARVIRAHQFANEGNWSQAEVMLAPLKPSIQKTPTPFVEELFQAIQQRGRLPSLESLPITQF
jgi:Tfp pilus assembly protein PilF